LSRPTPDATQSQAGKAQAGDPSTLALRAESIAHGTGAHDHPVFSRCRRAARHLISLDTLGDVPVLTGCRLCLAPRKRRSLRRPGSCPGAFCIRGTLAMRRRSSTISSRDRRKEGEASAARARSDSTAEREALVPRTRNDAEDAALLLGRRYAARR